MTGLLFNSKRSKKNNMEITEVDSEDYDTTAIKLLGLVPAVVCMH